MGRNPVRRLNNTELSEKQGGQSTITPSTTTMRKPRIQLGLKYNTEHKLLHCTIHKLINLHETPHSTLPNPYVKIYQSRLAAALVRVTSVWIIVSARPRP